MEEGASNPVVKKGPSLSAVLPWLLLFVVVLGLFTFWLHKSFQKRLAALEREVTGLEDRVEGAEAAARDARSAATTKEKPPETWSAAVEKLPSCSGWLSDPGAPAPADLSALGLGESLGAGYAPAVICVDKGAERLAGILAKEELTKPSPELEPACVDSCDSVVFVTADTRNGRMTVRKSKHQLGIYGEAYDQYCRIDSVFRGDDTGTDKMLFYCGSGESGGLTHWYQYDMSNDVLTLAMQFVGGDEPSNAYQVREGAIFDRFRVKRNP